MFAGIYRGFGVTLVRDVPSHGVYFGMIDYVRELMEPGSRRRGNKDASALFVAGVTPGMLSPSLIHDLHLDHVHKHAACTPWLQASHK